MRQDLPIELKNLISHTVSLLGKSIKEEYGQQFFGKVDGMRRRFRQNWSGEVQSWQKDLKLLNRENKIIESLTDEEKQIFAHCYTCMLELVNRCESAYRTYRLGQANPEVGKSDNWIIFVLTAHPTEARGPEFLAVFNRVTGLLVKQLKYPSKAVEDQLYHLLRIILKVPIARNKKPEVADEAQNIINYALKQEVLDLMVKTRQKGLNVMLRTWAGGDKDGHPGVDEKAMLSSLVLSRQELLIYIKRRLYNVQFEIEVMKNLNGRENLLENIKELRNLSSDLEKVSNKDGERVVSFRRKLMSFRSQFEEKSKLESRDLNDIVDLIWLFPALVLPLELREDSELVGQALATPNDFAIGRMLQTLSQVSEGNEAKWYVRGFVLSMCESAEDIKNGISLLVKTLGEHSVPVVPLFETEQALSQSCEIIEGLFGQNPKIKQLHHDKWGSRFEIMLGYSDSSKESGVFPSRLLISKAMGQLDKVLNRHKLTPVFFHGSGGSVERGGGSIQEQTRWWPKSAIRIFKATLQGESVARTFASPQILSGTIGKIAEENKRKREGRISKESRQVIQDFSLSVKNCYRKAVHDSDFLKVVEKASPYLFLSHLKIGSRPSKRGGELKVGGLRAIPWILCWTQTRTLFPTWWGVGTTWQNFDQQQCKRMIRAYRESDLLASYVKLLGFTLEKVELAVWRFYLENSDIPKELVDPFFEQFVSEFGAAKKFVHQLSGKKNLLWYRPWLGKSIDWRSPMIHPLNILQLHAVKANDDYLLRKTVTGIACGMLTTG